MIDRPFRVLLIEDDPDHAALIQRQMSGIRGPGVELEWADRLDAGLARLAQDDFDAVLADLGLPDSQGTETLARLLSAVPELPVIVLTALDDFEMGVRAVQQGAQDYLVKTHMTGELLVRAIRYGIERKRDRQRLETLNETLEQRVAEQTGEVRLLKDMAVIANESETVDQALRAALERIRGYLGWPVGHAYLSRPDAPETFFDTEIWSAEPAERLAALRLATRGTRYAAGVGLVGAVVESGRPHWSREIADDSVVLRRDELAALGVRTALAVPILLGGAAVAVLEFFSDRRVEPDPALADLMVHVATQLGRVVERRRLQTELIDAVWQQHQSFGKALHDGLGQELSGLRMMTESLQSRLRSKELAEADDVAELAALIRHAQSTTGQMIKSLYPVEIFSHGLMAALEELSANVRKQWDVECAFQCRQPVDVHSPEVATHLFRIAQNAAYAAVTRGDAGRVAISLAGDRSHVVLSVVDDGDAVSPGGNGRVGAAELRLMQYRANAIGATLSFERDDDGDNRLVCRMGCEACGEPE